MEGSRTDDRGGPVAVFSGGGTGGHLYPALALAEALAGVCPDVRAVFVGAERGLEARILPEREAEHVLLPVRGFSRDSLLANAGVVADLGRSLARVVSTFRRLRPEVVVVTGGYAGGPAGIAAGLLGIPLVLQEQNSFPGVTTRTLSRWARRVHLAFPEAENHLPARARRRIRVTGNPVRPPRTLDRGEAREAFGLSRDARVVLAVGGSQGSTALNELLVEAVSKVAEGRLHRPEKVEILWATGPANLDDVQAALSLSGSPAWVKALGYIDDVGGALVAADLAVSRAGAMTTSEFLAWGLPAVLVPLPTAAADHQSRNAQALEEAGAAIHLPQEGLTGEELWARVSDLVGDASTLERMGSVALERGSPGAAVEIAADIAGFMTSHSSGGVR